MTPTPSGPLNQFSPTESTLLSFCIAARNQEEAAEWLGISPVSIRRQLKELRARHHVDTNVQLFVLASISGAVDHEKVLPPRVAS